MKNNPVTRTQEEHIFRTFPLIHKTISHKLGYRHRDSVEDIKQKVFLKLWQWKTTRGGRDLSNEEWQKLANVVVHNELARFLGEKYNRDILFSQMDESTEITVFSIESISEHLEGNSETEIRSMLALVWKAAQVLTLRQKYAFILQTPNLLLEIIVHRYCSINELAAYLEATDEELAEIIDDCPLSNERIGELLGKKLNEVIPPRQIWEARSRAKSKLACFITNYTPDQ